MKDNKQISLMNYLAPLVMIALGLRHYAKHGVDLITIIPIVLGVFALYLAFFNHSLLERILKGILKLWTPVGEFIALLLLAVTFYLVFMPVGLFLRLFKKDILNRNFKVNQLSYWQERPLKQQNNYTQQF